MARQKTPRLFKMTLIVAAQLRQHRADHRETAIGSCIHDITATFSDNEIARIADALQQFIAVSPGGGKSH